MSGAMRAPMTGALFAAELTGHFSSLPSTIAAAGAAYAVSVLLMRRSILTEKIARRGRHILQEYVVDPLEFLQAEHLMTPNPETLRGDMTIANAVTFFANQARHRSYPVVDGEGRLLGLVSRTDALRWQVEGAEGAATLAGSVSDTSQPAATPETPCSKIADMIIETGVGRVPIIDPKTRRVVGILSRQDLLKARSEHRRAETDRTRFTPLPE